MEGIASGEAGLGHVGHRLDEQMVCLRDQQVRLRKLEVAAPERDQQRVWPVEHDKVERLRWSELGDEDRRQLVHQPVGLGAGRGQQPRKPSHVAARRVSLQLHVVVVEYSRLPFLVDPCGGSEQHMVRPPLGFARGAGWMSGTNGPRGHRARRSQLQTRICQRVIAPSPLVLDNCTPPLEGQPLMNGTAADAAWRGCKVEEKQAGGEYRQADERSRAQHVTRRRRSRTIFRPRLVAGACVPQSLRRPTCMCARTVHVQ